jgi:hypothetical protein
VLGPFRKTSLPDAFGEADELELGAQACAGADDFG